MSQINTQDPQFDYYEQLNKQDWKNDTNQISPKISEDEEDSEFTLESHYKRQLSQLNNYENKLHRHIKIYENYYNDLKKIQEKVEQKQEDINEQIHKINEETFNDNNNNRQNEQKQGKSKLLKSEKKSKQETKSKEQLKENDSNKQNKDNKRQEQNLNSINNQSSKKIMREIQQQNDPSYYYRY